MAKAKVEDIRNVVFCGHGSCGKTSLVDKFLVKSGAVNATPSVDSGNSLCDFDPEEKHHKYTIEAKAVHFTHAGKFFQVLDTPGYPDFIGQTIAALSGVEAACITINAQSGIEVNTRRVFDEAGKAGLARFIVINKMDGDNIDFDGLITNIRDLWGNGCTLVTVPIGKGADFKGVINTIAGGSADGTLGDPATLHDQLIETIVEADEEAMMKYLDGTPPTAEEIPHLLEMSVASGKLVPILCCSSKADLGVKELLDVLAACVPSPVDVKRKATKDGVEVEINPDPNGPLVAHVFRTRVDPFVQKLNFIRIYSGTIKRDDQVTVSTSRKPQKMGQLVRMQASESQPVESAGPGEIVAVAKMEELHTGAVLGEHLLPLPKFPTPMVGLAVTPKSRGDETKLSGALHKVVEEDPTFKLDRDAQTKELVMTGMSELHLTIVRERLHRRDKLDVDTKEPKIPFKETIQSKAEGMYRHKKQTGGRGQFGEVHIRMYPFPRGTKPEEYATKARFPTLKSFHYDESHNFLWVDTVVGGTIPGNFLPAIEKGFKERLGKGVITGYPVQDVCVEVHFGKHHPVDSSEAAFKTAGSMAFRNVFQTAKPCLLEPVVRMEITIPEKNVGDVYSDMSSRGGRVSGSDSAGGGYQTVKVEVALRSVSTYARTLSSMTGGQGSYSMEFAHYDVMPANVMQEIIAKTKMEEEEEE